MTDAGGAPEADRAARLPNGIVRALLALGVYALAGGAAQAVLLTAPPGDFAVRVEQESLVTALASLALVAFAAWLPPPGACWRPGALRAVALYALFLVAWVPFAHLAYPAILRALEVPFELQPTVRYLSGESATGGGELLVLLLACALGPLAEEIVFRGYIQQALKRLAATWIAVGVTAMLFGAIHGPLYAVPVGLLGLLFGVVRERFNCLGAAVVVHVLHNTMTVAVVRLLPQLFTS